MLTVSVKYDIAPLNVHHIVLTNTEFLPHLCLHLSCSSDFDLDYDSYHEDYYDRYCQKAAHAGSHTLLLVCVSQEAKRGFFILAVPGSLCSLSLSVIFLLNSQELTHDAHTLKDIYCIFHMELHTYCEDTQIVQPNSNKISFGSV